MGKNKRSTQREPRESCVLVSYHVFIPYVNKEWSKKEGDKMRYTYVWAKNRPSPSNEDDWVEAYKRAVPEANADDNYDIAAVVTDSGMYGHALMHYSYNRSRDNQYHQCRLFVSDDELRLFMY